MRNICRKILAVRIPIEDSKRYAKKNRKFIESCFPESLALYDQFISFVFANCQGYEYVGVDVTDILLMDDDYTVFSDEMLGNQEAFTEKEVSKLGDNFSLADRADIIGYLDGYSPSISFESQTGSVILEVDGEEGNVGESIQPSFFEKYKWYIFGGVVGIVVVLRNILGGN